MLKKSFAAARRRRGWIAAAALLLLAAAGAVYLPQGIGTTPSTVARETLRALVSGSPAMSPLTLDLPTTTAIAYLRARVKQDVELDIKADAGERSTPRRFRTLVQVQERDGEHAPRGPRFRVELEQADDGVWRVSDITLNE